MKTFEYVWVTAQDSRIWHGFVFHPRHRAEALNLDSFSAIEAIGTISAT